MKNTVVRRHSSGWFANKIRSLLLIIIGAIPIALSVAYHIPMDITGAILPIFIGGCTLVSKE